jgi:hypothetical protein
VAAGAPRRLTSGSILDTGFDDSVEPDGDTFTARTATEVARWGSRGQPASPGTDTVYVVGRTSGAFARLADLRAGSTITIRTDNGTLRYRVASVATVPVSGFARNPVVTAPAGAHRHRRVGVPGRRRPAERG